MGEVDDVVKNAFVFIVAVLTGTLPCVSHHVRKEEREIHNSMR